MSFMVIGKSCGLEFIKQLLHYVLHSFYSLVVVFRYFAACFCHFCWSTPSLFLCAFQESEHCCVFGFHLLSDLIRWIRQGYCCWFPMFSYLHLDCSFAHYDCYLTASTYQNQSLDYSSLSELSY